MFIPGLGGSWYGLLPLATGGCFLVGIVVPYIIAVHLGHVYPVLPYISDTGALHPENCVFGQMLNLTGFFMVFVVHFRYKQVARVGPAELVEINKAATFLGYASAAFVSLVGNIQINVNYLNDVETEAHLFCAVLGFGSSLLFGLAQSWITYKLADDVWSVLLAALRFALTIAGFVFCVTLIEFGELAYAEFNGTYPQTLHWNPNDGGYEYHVYSSASEYLFGFMLIALIMSLYKELSAIPTPAGRKTNPVEKSANNPIEEVARDSLLSGIHI